MEQAPMANWQRSVADFAHRHSLLHDPATHALDLVSEVVEVTKELLADELGETLDSLLALAEACGGDADGAPNAALEKYERRLTGRGKAESI